MAFSKISRIRFGLVAALAVTGFAWLSTGAEARSAALSATGATVSDDTIPTVDWFYYESCYLVPEDSTTYYDRRQVSWNVNDYSSGWTWEIWAADNPSFTGQSVNVSATNDDTTTTLRWEIFVPGTGPYMYYRIRYVKGVIVGPWHEMDNNPIDMGECIA